MATTTYDIAGLQGRVEVTSSDLDELRARFEGPLLRAGDEGWDNAVLL
jgi:hypothetical protein